MTVSIKCRVTALAAAAVLAGSPLLLPTTAADAAARLRCHATISDSSPAQYSNVYVHVKTAPRARVRTVAHYSTTDTAHTRTASSRGKATIRYNIYSARVGYRVVVDVKVTKNGRSKTCSTSFRPHA